MKTLSIFILNVSCMSMDLACKANLPWLRCTGLFRYPLQQLMSTLRELYPKDGSVRLHHGRHVLFEYVMLQGINDSPVDAHRLLVLTEGIECKYNLIGFNQHAGTRFLPSPPQQVRLS